MQNETEANPSAGFTWTDPAGMPRHTNGAFDPNTQTVKADAPVHPTPSHVLTPTEQAAEDWRKHTNDDDLVSQRAKFSKTADFLALRMYDNTIAQLRHPALSNTQTSRNWRRNAPRTATRKAAA